MSYVTKVRYKIHEGRKRKCCILYIYLDIIFTGRKTRKHCILCVTIFSCNNNQGQAQKTYIMLYSEWLVSQPIIKCLFIEYIISHFIPPMEHQNWYIRKWRMWDKHTDGSDSKLPIQMAPIIWLQELKVGVKNNLINYYHTNFGHSDLMEI